MIAPQSNRVRVWPEQFEAGHFPPICVMTGEPSETSLKFRFARSEGCFGDSIALVFGLVWFVIRDRVTGRLPLTRRSRRYVLLLRWIPVGLIAGTFGLWILGAILGLGGSSTDPVNQTTWGIFFFVGLLALMSGAVGTLVVKPLAGPRGSLKSEGKDQFDFVEIRNVHPRFAAAVETQHASALAESSGSN